MEPPPSDAEIVAELSERKGISDDDDDDDDDGDDDDALMKMSYCKLLRRCRVPPYF